MIDCNNFRTITQDILSRTEIDVRDSLKFALSVFVIYRRKPCNQREPLEITILYDRLKRFFCKTHQITLVIFINIHFQNTFLFYHLLEFLCLLEAGQ